MSNVLSTSTLAQLTLTRFREFLREPEALFWTFVFPILLAGGLGVAFRSRGPEVFKIVAVTSELARTLRSETRLDVQQLPLPAAEEALRVGKVVLLAEPAHGGGVLYRYDATGSEGNTARMLADRAVQHAAGQTDPVPTHDTPVTERGSRYIDFLIPGLVGMNVMGSSMWGLGFAIVDMRRRKLMKRYIATPMPHHLFLLAFVLSRLVLLTVEVGFVLAFGVLVFQTPLRGSWLELAAICILISLSFTSLGLLTASRAQTIEAVSGLMNVIMMPMWIASGVFFSAQHFPLALQPVIRALPLTAAIDALRANMLQGAGLAQVAPELGVLTAWLAGSSLLALKLFRWR